MIHVNIRERDASAKATEPITTGSVGLPVQFRFSDDWQGLGRAAVFKGSGQQVDMVITDNACVVPHEVLQRAGGKLKIGVYGTGDQGQRVTPTIWADAGLILKGAEPSGVEPTPATQSLAQQLLEAAQEARDAAEAAEELAQSVRDDADNGAFDGEAGAAGPQGADGVGIPAGGSTGQILKKKSGTDYDSEWANESSDIFFAVYGTTTSAEVAAALTDGKVVMMKYADQFYQLANIGDLGSDRTYIFVHTGPSNVSTYMLVADTWSYVGSFTIPSASSAIPQALGTAAVGTSGRYARADHVHAMPTAAQVGAVASDQGSANAGKFLVVGSDGNITTVTMTAWQGGNY